MPADDLARSVAGTGQKDLVKSYVSASWRQASA